MYNIQSTSIKQTVTSILLTLIRTSKEVYNLW
jgi:hypothetical protein